MAALPLQSEASGRSSTEPGDKAEKGKRGLEERIYHVAKALFEIRPKYVPIKQWISDPTNIAHKAIVKQLLANKAALIQMRDIFGQTDAALGERFNELIQLTLKYEEMKLARKRQKRDSDHNLPLLELPPELLGLVARALLCDDPQADAQAVGRLAASSKALRELVRGNDVVVAELQAARKMLTLQRQHELFVAAGRLGKRAAFPFDPSDYKQVALQLPAPEATLDLRYSRWRVAAGEERGRAVARLLRVSGSLTNLNLKGCWIDDEGAKALAAGVAASSSLATLSLDGGHEPFLSPGTKGGIGDEGATALAAGVAASGSLVKVNLSNNQIGALGAKALAAGVAASGSLVSLSLKNNNIGNEGAKALAAGVAASGSLACLNLDANYIGDMGAKAISEALLSSGSLAELGLNNNRIGNEGAKALAAGVAASSSLVKLNLSYNQIGDKGAKAIAEALLSSGYKA